ncbi:MAG: hypothetical protein GF315_09805 [candidate division Zixibacteria bacterium]|nr:hypothetical protein [candidate division Zixibacteria bacterium]
MKLFQSKKGIGMGQIGKYIGAIIGIVVLFLLLADLVPEAQTAGDTLNESGVPLGSLFASSGVLFVIIMAGVLLFVVGYFWKKK